MKIEISLKHYLQMGGKLENIDWINEAKLNIGNKYNKLKILNYVNKNLVNQYNEMLLDFRLDNGELKTLTVSSIIVNVDFELTQRYTG